ncbi:E2F transcription factor-like E2FE isoform X2 [Salvia miltiorrhiza]|uniref:E2F transcription factor-like E2FE isoform X2 n=1 Tax=Salvia miltiorrhiza TaxID=226208 RepID=UPI0025AC0545|nr:E2F transcription factor-like E2FE isoform X2 [Salvia miltiorrhiza]
MASRDSRTKDAFYCRKEKSLGLLCTNFLRLYDREGVDSIGLDAAALQLGVERRRIYDIVNILEGIGVLQKKEKNQYTWKGFAAISGALEVLKEQGEKEEFHTYITNVSNEKERSLLSDSKTECPDKCSKSDKEHRREKSLGLLTQNFVKLFLCSEVEIISLDGAALALLGDSHDRTAMRTKVRRLYDIANVFSSMGLIEKVRDPESGKPAFRWTSVGRSRNRSSIASDGKNCKRRAFGDDITNTSVKKCKTIALTEQHQKYSSKDFVFGPFAPNVSMVESHETSKDGQIQNWDNLFCAHRPQYSNKAVGDLFHHYAEAWSNWRDEAKDKQQIEHGS